MPWDPNVYHKFQQQRAAPFEDLSALVHRRPGLRVVDLGCGTGELTRRLADMLPESDVVGIDSSAEMLAEAAQYAGPGLRFEQRAIEDVGGSWDLIFSHAALQWLDDHERLIPALFGMLTPGGQLAVQMPSNHHHYAHVAARQLAESEPYATAMQRWTRKFPVLSIEDYAGLLFAAGADEIVVFEKIYPHVLKDADAIADWTSGTLLVPYMERLPEALRERFMTDYRARLRERWPESPVFYGFRRTLFSATAPQSR